MVTSTTPSGQTETAQEQPKELHELARTRGTAGWSATAAAATRTAVAISGPRRDPTHPPPARPTLGFSCEGPTFTSASAPPSRQESMPQLQAPSSAASPCSAALRSSEAADAHLKSASAFENPRSAEMLHGGRPANVLTADSTSTLRQAHAQGRRAQTCASDLEPCKARDALRATGATRAMPTSHERCFAPHVPAPTSFRRGAAPWPTTSAGARRPGTPAPCLLPFPMTHPLASTRVRRTLSLRTG